MNEEQWTVIITRIFSDHNPATIISNIIKTIGGYQKKDLSHTK